jgi:Tfp pilus assembly protein PilN
MQDDATLNFLPDDYVAARNRSRANKLCGGLLVIVILSVAGAFSFAETSLHQLRAEHAQVTEQFDQEASRLKQLDTLQKQQQSLARRAALAEALVQKTTRTMLMNELTALLPEDTSLAELTLTSRVRERVRTPEELLAEKQSLRNGKPLTPVVEPKRYAVSLKLAGLAYTDVQVALFINRLSRSSYFEDVNLLVSKEFTLNGQTVRRFEVDMVVREEPLTAQRAGDAVVSTEALPGR